MSLLRALRISQNGPKGTIFQAEGNRAKHLTAGKNPIAESVTHEQLARERLDAVEAKEAEADKAEADKAHEEAKAAEDAKEKAKVDAAEHDPDIDGPDETKPAPKPNKKGGKKPADAGKAAEAK